MNNLFCWAGVYCVKYKDFIVYEICQIASYFKSQSPTEITFETSSVIQGN